MIHSSNFHSLVLKKMELGLSSNLPNLGENHDCALNEFNEKRQTLLLLLTQFLFHCFSFSWRIIGEKF